MKENVINFDTETFRQKLKENGLSIQDAGLLIGKSKLFWYQHLKSGTIDKSTFFKFHELLRTSPKPNKDDVTRLDYEKEFTSYPLFSSWVKKHFTPEEANIIYALADRIMYFDKLTCHFPTKSVSLWTESGKHHISVSHNNTDMDDNSMKELNEDYQLLKELGLERVFRLYALAEYEKRRQS